MKTKKHLIVFLFIAAMAQSLLFNAQSMAYKAVSPPKGWQSIKMDEKGSNVKNGVEFYNNTAECNSLKAKVFKLVNTNAFAVKVSYQTSADSPVVNIMVPALITLEGSCAATDGNMAKLVIIDPIGKTKEEKQKTAEYMRTHLTVIQIQ